YQARLTHVEGFNNCTQCHDKHNLTVNVQACGSCHTNVKSEEDLKAIRMSPTDYDGDGDITEGLAGEVATLHEKLYAAIQAYAKNVAGSPIAYSPAAYPYFFIDTNGNGQVDPDEANAGNRYASWTPRLLRAAYNYQYVAKDPGAFAHNGKYILQVLYDTLQDLAKKVPVDLGGAVRP
ncbi:MAG: polyheme membrane-associated cytochrome C, partial [Chloroflexia bacterium]